MGLLDIFGKRAIDSGFTSKIKNIGITQKGVKNLTQIANGEAVKIGNRSITQDELFGFARNGIKDMNVAKELGFVGRDGKFKDKAFDNFKAALRSNTSISGNVADIGKNHETVGSAINFINEYRSGESVGQAAKNIFLKDPTGGFDTDNIHYARGMAAIGTGMVAARAGIGAINGITTDSAGNADIAGIPFF